MTLAGKTILVTRPADSSAEFRTLLESRGASVVCFPAIEITDPESWESCDCAIWKLSEYDTVCFTSRNAVDKFIQRMRIIRPQALNTLATRSLYAVGKKTAETLEALGFAVEETPHVFTSGDFAGLFRGKEMHGRRVLFPKSTIARDEFPRKLRNLGAAVDEAIVYRTVAPASDRVEQIIAMLAEDKLDCVTFFSPSSVRNFIEWAGAEKLHHVLIAVIGPTTAAAVEEFGLPAPIVAQQHTAEGIADSLERYWNQKK